MSEEKENIVTLSSGVEVKFNRLPPNDAQDLVVAMIEKVTLTEDGEVITDDMTMDDQIDFAKMVSDAHDRILIAGMLTDENPPVELVSKLPKDNNWLKVLFMRPDVKNKLSPFTYDDAVKDKKIKTFVYLRYMAFKSQEDWEKITTQTLL